jgi:hypothetical protein
MSENAGSPTGNTNLLSSLLTPAARAGNAMDFGKMDVAPMG